MPLAELQSALGMLIATADAAPNIPNDRPHTTSVLQLSSAERDWLHRIRQSHGFQVTCAIQRWWRETRMRDFAKLTIRALGVESANQMIVAYLRQSICTSLFFLPETLAFLRFVAERTDQPHCRSIALFECALLQAREEVEMCNPTSTIIEFYAPPLELLNSLLRGQPLPQPATTCFYVRVSATLPQCWQPLTAEELSQLRKAQELSAEC